jgi:hydroxyacylglutathione hydrolase
MPLTERATWWPSTLYQTSTLELRLAGQRLLVDPGISPWEIDEVVAASVDPVSQVLITHADWDHILGIPSLPEAQITASRAAAERIDSGQARESVEKESGEAYVVCGDLSLLRVDRRIDAPSGADLGPWHVVMRTGHGHTDDGLVTSFPEEGLLVTGDYLSGLEVPAAYVSVHDYRDTLQTLIGVIERERPHFVVVGHGRPHTSEQALRIADEDLDYVEAVLAFADGGCRPEEAAKIAVPDRGGGPFDETAHVTNVRLACAALTPA